MSSIDFCDMYSSVSLWCDCLGVLKSISLLALLSLHYIPGIELESSETKTEMEGLQNKLFNNLITLDSMLLIILVLMLPLNV